MASFKQRSYLKELLDRDDIPFEAIKRNMQELDLINQRLGGHTITLTGFKQLIKDKDVHAAPLDIVEIGCGGGDNLRVIKNWAGKQGLPVSLKGIDSNRECVSFAESQAANRNIQFICSDYKEVCFTSRPDIIFSSLFCHHFTDEELIKMLGWMKTNSRTGFFINDLHRHPLAFYSIKLLTQLFSKSFLVKNDAPLSVKRGFKKRDWNRLFAAAGISDFSCRWKWAFRWLITFKHATTAAI
jgi:2-polyprenyl-3-methyl-5-hydroxy-6-metoxy-1,4-benzoquinol methylase